MDSTHINATKAVPAVQKSVLAKAAPLILLFAAWGCVAPTVPLAPVTADNVSPWWPIHSGDAWTFRDVDNGGLSTWTVRDADLGICGNPQFIVRATKSRPDTYWAYGADIGLDWMLRVEPDGSIWSPAQVYLDNAGRPLKTVQTPINILLPPTSLQIGGYERTIDIQTPSSAWLPMFDHGPVYWGGPGEHTQCPPPSDPGYTPPVYWKISASIHSDLLTIDYVEVVYGWESEWVVHPDVPYYERWTFKRGIGPWVIENGDANRHTHMQRVLTPIP